MLIDINRNGEAYSLINKRIREFFQRNHYGYSQDIRIRIDFKFQAWRRGHEKYDESSFYTAALVTVAASLKLIMGMKTHRFGIMVLEPTSG